jgi:CheY-like chemotaxis protein
LLDIEKNHPHYQNLKNIQHYVKAGADLTMQLLGAAKGGKYQSRPTNLNQILESSANLFGRTKKEITIHKRLQKDLWVVEADRGQIEQVLLNLYVNAWQAMPGGGRLYLESRNVNLDENAVKAYGLKVGRYVRISVTDTGTGIPAKDLRRIFDPFFTTKGMGRGTGLGLTSAYGIVTNHGGMISVYSEVGSGSTFNINLPASREKVIEDEETTPDIVMGHETVLYVDDEEGILEIGQSILERLGYKAVCAPDGKTAVDVYRRRHREIDVVILDMIMPDQSGGETFSEMKKINPGVRVILSSGYSLNGRAREILDRGCRGFIQKPFNIKELSHKLRQVLEAG